MVLVRERPEVLYARSAATAISFRMNMDVCLDRTNP
jgi:hypothetical protein